MNRTRWFLSTLAFLVLFDTLQARTVVKCPEFCFCDEFEGLKRATCSHRRLYSIEINLPPQAEVLDLSHNQISELGDKIFIETNLTHLKLLNLSHNKVSQIHLNGFEGLTKLRTLDLSYNAMRYFIESWFTSLNSLEELYLRGNNLKSINEEPRISLSNLKVLDLSRCGITHLYPKIFTETPILEKLDLSQNYLTFLSTEVLKPLKHLSALNLMDNNFSCKDRIVGKLRSYTRHRGIAYKDTCPQSNSKKSINHKNIKFEKMIMKIEDEVHKQNTEGRNAWIFDDKEDEDIKSTNIIEICSNVAVNGTDGLNNCEPEGFLMKIISLNPWLVMLVTLVYGIMIGLVLGCTVQIKGKKPRQNEESDLPDGSSIFLNSRMSRNISTARISEDPNTKNDTAFKFNNFRPRSRSAGTSRLSRSLSRPRGGEATESLMMSEYDLANSTPVTPRKLYV